MSNTLTLPQLTILQHCMGVDQFGRGTQFRNHFVTDADGPDGNICESLVSMGLMTRRDGMGELTGGMPCYIVTAAGKVAVAEQSPPPPPKKPLTRAQQRYQRFMDADSGLTFHEWLKCRGDKIHA